MSGPTNGREFRRQLDDVLRQRNPAALRDFLVSAGQWDAENTPADLDRAMWMMIAASAALPGLHGEAQRWLVDHGFTQEAQAILGRGSGGLGTRGGAGQPAKTRGSPSHPLNTQRRRPERGDGTSHTSSNQNHQASRTPRQDDTKPPGGKGRKP